jgi:ubiquinone/menaquinone biosynthesis C-methylase UbiE
VSDLQHPDSRPFELVADLYERARPDYPRDAVAWLAAELALHEGRSVLDLGAGTGKLTRQLLETGARVVAVEPGDAMRAELERAVPGVQAVRGSAEEIPLPDDSVDAVTVGQAFHWFRHDEALPEIHRVLRTGGGIALIWNSRDQEAALQREVDEVLHSLVPPHRAAAGTWSRALVESDLFEPVEERRFRFTQELDADTLAERVASISYVAASPAGERARIDSQLRAIVERLGGRIDFPYVTDVYVSRAA